MAKRVCFCIIDNSVVEKEIEFKYYSGFALSQKQKSIISFHEEIHKQINGNILEVSSKSLQELGVKLSAFNLMVEVNGRFASVESIFQSAKVFENGGPYVDLLYQNSKVAKKDVRIRNSGQIIGFEFNGKKYSNEPRDAFYNYIYGSALLKNKKFIPELINFDVFTDIEFNKEKSLNCQARALAYFVLLYRNGLINEAFKSFENFNNTILSFQNRENINLY